VLELRQVPDSDVDSRREEALEHVVSRRMRLSFDDRDQAHAVAREMLERNAPDVTYYDVVEDGARVGTMSWWCPRDECEVSDLVLDDPGRAPELLPTLLALARAAGAHSLGVAAVPGEPARERLADVEGFVSRATNMALPLDGEIGDPGSLVLRPMTLSEFEAFFADSSESYVDELVSAGMTPESARAQADRQLAELIPDGLDSPGQAFFTAWVDESPVGTLWLSTERPMAFVYDILVHESARRRGYGEAIMNAAARWCRDLGHPALGLNVFAHNPGARALYEKLGYQVTADYRSIDLGDAG